MAAAKWFTVINKSLTRAGRKAPAQYGILATTKTTKSGPNALDRIIYDPFPLGGGPAIDRRAEYYGTGSVTVTPRSAQPTLQPMQQTTTMRTGVTYQTPGGFKVTIHRPYQK
jgi:hypothetical protein